MIYKKRNQLRPSFMIVWKYSVLLLRSICFFFDGSFISWFKLFCKQHHQYFISVLQSTQDDQNFPWQEQVIQLKCHLFPFLYPYRSLVGKANSRIVWICHFCFLVFATEEIAVLFAMTKPVSSWSIAKILNFTSFRSILNYLEPFSIINHPFDK